MLKQPTIIDIQAAAARLDGLAIRTPLLSHPALDARVGGRMLLKCENLQRVGAFKFRGAYNKLVQLDFTVYPGGVVACSSGNHAQGVAAAAQMLGVPALIVMPADAPRAKIAGTRSYGAEVVLYDREREDRDAIATHHASARRAAFVPPFDDFDIISGQGTAGLEIMEDLARLGLRADQVLVPCSGGGLTCGVAIAVKAHDRDARVIAVEPAGFDDMARSLATGTPQRNERMSGTICDALMMVTPGKLNFAIARELVSEGVGVSDEEVRQAMRFAFETLKLVVEPGGAVGLAAALTGRVATEGRTTVVVLSGGNADRETMMQLMA